MLKNIWKTIANKPIDIWFFYLFLSFSTLSIRKTIIYFPIKQIFNEYTGIYLYISDIFLFFTIISWIFVILYNKYKQLSIKNNLHTLIIHNLYGGKSVDNYSHKSKSSKKFFFLNPFLLKIKNCSTWNNLNTIIIILTPLFMFFLSFLTIYQTKNITIDYYRTTKFLELYFLFLYLVFRISKIVPRGTILNQNNALFYLYYKSTLLGLIFIMFFDHYLWDIWQGQILFWFICGMIIGVLHHNKHIKNCSTWNNLSEYFKPIFLIIIFIGSIQSMIGLIQIYLQHQIGLSWLRESFIGPNITGVAKIILNGNAYIRAYGLFPHPNILGGFLFFSIMFTFLYKKLFYQKQFLKIKLKTNNCINILLLIQLIGILISFSKSAIIALILAISYVTVLSEINWKATAINNVKALFYWNINKKISLLAIFAISIITTLFLFRLNYYTFFMKSLLERSTYLTAYWQIILKNPFFGVGTGQSILVLEKIYPNWVYWQYQPVHNVFVLIWSEWGIVGLILFIFFLWKVFYFKGSCNSD